MIGWGHTVNDLNINPCASERCSKYITRNNHTVKGMAATIIVEGQVDRRPTQEYFILAMANNGNQKSSVVVWRLSWHHPVLAWRRRLRMFLIYTGMLSKIIWLYLCDNLRWLISWRRETTKKYDKTTECAYCLLPEAGNVCASCKQWKWK